MSTADPELPPEPSDARGRQGEREDDGGLDVEAAFAEIVAHWNAENPPAVPPPAVPPLASPAPATAPPEVVAGTRASGPPPDDSERWSPPELPPMTRAGWRSWLPWVAVLGSPAFFLVVVLANLHLPGLALVAGVVVFMAGFVILVLRLPARRDDDSDGAVL